MPCKYKAKCVASEIAKLAKLPGLSDLEESELEKGWTLTGSH